MNALAHSGISTTDIVVELDHVSKIFRQRQPSERWQDALRNLFQPPLREVKALQDVSLRIHRGEIVAYAGPNGAGKSTTVKLLSGMLSPDSGTVRSLGFDPVRERAKYVARIGVVFGQRTELWWDQPVAATFEWKRVVWDIPPERFERMLGRVKELLGLNEFFHSLARELSLGQRMRADLALALMPEPEILFLDEPTLGLDVLAKRNMLQFLQQINREQSVTIMLTSHDMDDLEQLAGRIVLIQSGKIAFDGDFTRLRREFADHRYLILQTREETAPRFVSAELVKSEAGRHEYVFDAARVSIATLLEQAATQSDVLDVETHRAPIDEVIADIYQHWQETSRA
jgi:ABC-2 type transport system ATP-binding protein